MSEEQVLPPVRRKSATLSIEFSYDTSRGVYVAKHPKGTFMFAGGGVDSPMPQTLRNALDSLRQNTYATDSAALRHAAEYEAKPEVREALRQKIIEFERKGGRVQTQGVTRAELKPTRSSLSLDDLGL